MPNTIELTYSLYGDANPDGQVNSAALQALLFTLNTNLGNQATPMAIAATATVQPTGTTGPVVHHPHAGKVSARKRR
jgi:hypothetical protein